MTKLSAEAGTNIVRKVLFTEGELNATGGKPPENTVIVDGLIRKYGFHRERLNQQKPEIDALLLQLPDTFNRDVGGGWSFLNGCVDADGNQWGEQRDVETLVSLGIGVGSAAWVMKDMMAALPGGVPYFEVHPTA